MSISASRTSRVCAIHTIVDIREAGISSTSGKRELDALSIRFANGGMGTLVRAARRWQAGRNYIDAFNTEAACIEESQQRASRAKQNRKVLNSGPTHFTDRSVNGTYMLSYICVPASVDPRPN